MHIVLASWCKLSIPFNFIYIKSSKKKKRHRHKAAVKNPDVNEDPD